MYKDYLFIYLFYYFATLWWGNLLAGEQEKYVLTKEITSSKGVHLSCVCLVPGQ